MVDHTAIFRWAQRYAPELEHRRRLLLKATHDSYGVDEITIGINTQRRDLDRAVDSTGATTVRVFATETDEDPQNDDAICRGHATGGE